MESVQLLVVVKVFSIKGPETSSKNSNSPKLSISDQNQKQKTFFGNKATKMFSSHSNYASHHNLVASNLIGGFSNLHPYIVKSQQKERYLWINKLLGSVSQLAVRGTFRGSVIFLKILNGPLIWTPFFSDGNFPLLE